MNLDIIPFIMNVEKIAKLVKILGNTICIFWISFALLYIVAVCAHGAPISYALNEIWFPTLVWVIILLLLNLLYKYLKSKIDKD